MKPETIIAERSWIAVKKIDGSRRNVHLRVGKPYWINDKEAKCAVMLEGLFEDLEPATGIDTVQALELALSVESIIKMKSDEYDFYYPEDGSHYFDENAPNIEV